MINKKDFEDRLQKVQDYFNNQYIHFYGNVLSILIIETVGINKKKSTKRFKAILFLENLQAAEIFLEISLLEEGVGIENIFEPGKGDGFAEESVNIPDDVQDEYFQDSVLDNKYEDEDVFYLTIKNLGFFYPAYLSFVNFLEDYSNFVIQVLRNLYKEMLSKYSKGYILSKHFFDITELYVIKVNNIFQPIILGEKSKNMFININRDKHAFINSLSVFKDFLKSLKTEIIAIDARFHVQLLKEVEHKIIELKKTNKKRRRKHRKKKVKK